MSAIENPCKDCTRRYSGCHSNCEDYKKFRQALDERNALIRQERGRIDNIRDGIIESRRRVIRRKRSKYRHKY